MPKIIVHRADERTVIEYSPGENLLRILHDSGVFVENPCNGRGTCGKCGVRVSGEDFLISEREARFNLGQMRLACMIEPSKDIEVFVEGDEKSRGFLNAEKLPDVEFNPYVRLKTGFVEKPKLRERTSWKEQFEKVFGKFDHDILFNMDIDEGEYTGVYAGDDLIAIRKGEFETNLAAAIDVGTTTVQIVLVDVCSGCILSTRGFVNPQKDFGSDVITRISYAGENPDGLEKMARSLREKIEQEIKDMISETGASTDDLYELVVSANTAMLHILLGIDPQWIGRAPYAPVFRDRVQTRASKIGMQFNNYTLLTLLPGVSAYIGADIVSGAVAADIESHKGNTLFIDIGTNGEIILKKGEKMTATSCAAGPALEGMNISCGMRAQEGAVEDVHMDERTGDISVSVIGDTPPKGICGSGLLGIISELLRTGLIDRNGRLKKFESGEDTDKRNMWYERDAAKPTLRIADGVYIARSDIRSVQLSKAAILSGIAALVENSGMNYEDIDEYIVAGQFGKHLTEAMLVNTGLLPECATGKIRYAGNTSIDGALIAVMNRDLREKMNETAKKIDFLELSTVKDYDRIFIRTSYFPVKED